MTTSTQFALPTGKPSSVMVEAKKAIATAKNISQPQTWSAAVPGIQADFLARTVTPRGVPAIPQRPTFTTARPMDVPATSIAPANRPVVVVPTQTTPARRPNNPFLKPPSAPRPPTITTSYNPMAIPATTTTSAVSCAPQAVPGATTPSWPAPGATPGIAISKPALTELPVERTSAGTVIGASIFGGPITVGDPEVGLLHLNPYTEIEELPPAAAPSSTAAAIVRPSKAAAEPLDKGEGWRDVFGISHGHTIPKERQVGIGRGMFNVQAPLAAMGMRGFGEEKKEEPSAWNPANWSTTTWVVAGVGAAALVGGIAYYMSSKKK